MVGHRRARSDSPAAYLVRRDRAAVDQPARPRRCASPSAPAPTRSSDWEYGQKLAPEAQRHLLGREAARSRNAEYQWRSEGSVRAAMITNDEADIADRARTRGRRRRSRRGVPQQRDHRAAHARAPRRPLNDIRVRQAINYAVNRTGIVKALFRGMGEPAAQLIPSGVVGFNSDLHAVAARPGEGQGSSSTRRGPTACRWTRQIRLIGRTAQFPKITETVEVHPERADRDRPQRQDRDDGHRRPVAVPAAAVPGQRRAVPRDDHARQPGR